MNVIKKFRNPILIGIKRNHIHIDLHYECFRFNDTLSHQKMKKKGRLQPSRGIVIDSPNIITLTIVKRFTTISYKHKEKHRRLATFQNIDRISQSLLPAY